MSDHPPTVSTTPLPAGRGCVNDIAVLALDIPLFPVDRLMRLDAVAAAHPGTPWEVLARRSRAALPGLRWEPDPPAKADK